MTPTNFKKSLFIATFVIAEQSFADTQIVGVHDWSLWETTVNNTEICYMHDLNKAIFRAEDYFIEISKVKNKINSPVEVLMRIQNNKKGSTGLVAAVPAGSSVISFSDLDGKKESFWGVPKNLSLLIAQLKANQDDIAITAKGGKKEIDFSFAGRGFKEVLAEMEKRCNGGLPIVNAAFENEFLGSVSSTIEPTALSSVVTNQLRVLYFSSYSVFSQLSDSKSLLEGVLAKYRPLVDELNLNRSRSSQIANQELPNSQKTLADSKKQQVDSKNEIAKIDSLLPGLVAQVQAAQKAYDAARAVLSPLEPEFNRLTSNIENTQQSLGDAQSRLAAVDRRLQEIAQQAQSLESEARSLENWLPQKRNELDRATTARRNAEVERNQFNVSWERDRRLNNNGEYRNMQNEKSSVDGNISSVQIDLNQVRAERNRITNDLNQCHASAIQITAIVESGHIVPGPSGQDSAEAPPLPGDVATIAAADCSQLEQALNVANSAVAEKESLLNNLVSRRDQLSSAIASIERDVDYTVRREYEVLVNREDQARKEETRKQDEVRQDQDRITRIRNSDLPRLENERSQLSSERPSVVARIGQATSDIDRLSRELAKFKLTNDWDRKAAAVDSKANQLSSDQSNLSNAQGQKVAAQIRIEKSAATEALMKKKIDQLTVELAALNQRAIALEQGIKNLPAERAPLDAKIAELQNDVTAKKNDFLLLLR
ncbi:MAG: hypothetical protein WA160_14045 [Pseudobdellovibrio sp.]